MIPRTIHYCWFGRNPLPDEFKSYMETWRRYCADYKIIEWNEDNFDVSENAYCREAYEEKKWAFVSDYARLKIIYEQGGVYLDTDIELLQSLEPLISSGDGFLGFQNEEEVNTGLGFAAAPHNICVRKMLALYEDRHFRREDGAIDVTPCPVANTVALKQCGLMTGKKACSEIQQLDGINILPILYLNPLDRNSKKLHITDNTYLIHHYSCTWNTKMTLKRRLKKRIPRLLLDYLMHSVSRRDIARMERELKGNGRQ